MFLACEHEIIFYLTLVHKKCFASNFSLFLYQIYANKGKSSRQVSDRIYDATDCWIFLVYICMYIGNSKMHVILYVIYMCTMYHVVHQRWRSRNPGEHSYDVRFLGRQVRPGNRATLELLCTYFYICRTVGMVPVIPYPPKNNWLQFYNILQL